MSATEIYSDQKYNVSHLYRIWNWQKMSKQVQANILAEFRAIQQETIFIILYVMMSAVRTVSHSYLPAMRPLPNNNRLGPSLPTIVYSGCVLNIFHCQGR